MKDQWGKALQCLGLTKDGHPRHPLYMSGKSVPLVWSQDGCVHSRPSISR